MAARLEGTVPQGRPSGNCGVAPRAPPAAYDAGPSPEPAMTRLATLLCLVPSALLAVLLLGPGTAPAAPSRPEVAYEYKHLILPVERRLEAYEKADVLLLEALRRSGEEGWELVSAYEPPNGVMVGQRASVEFWLKRAYVPGTR